MPQKENESGKVTFLITIDNVNIVKELVDLGASINLVPFEIVRTIANLELKKTKMNLQLADKSINYTCSITKDVLVRVDKLLFPLDFIIMNI